MNVALSTQVGASSNFRKASGAVVRQLLLMFLDATAKRSMSMS